MFGKNKYEVMDKKLRNCKKKLGILFAKLVVLSLKADRDEINNDDLVKLFCDAIPIIKTNAHIAYENNNDLQQISSEYIYNYLKQEEMPKQVYEIDYKESINIYTQILLFFAVMERNGIDPLINDMETVMKLFDGSDLDNFMNGSMNQLDSNSQMLIEQLFENDFDINNLNDQLKKILDEYHFKYMQAEIYPSVNDQSVTKKQVLKLTNKYLKKLQ